MDLKLDNKTHFHSMRDFVYHTLRSNILNLKFEPGRSISESEISELLEVSRTPVREAFLKLTQDELLEVFPQKGTIVSLIDLESVEEARFMREHIERAIAQLACKKQFSNDSLVKLEYNLNMQEFAVKSSDYTKLFELDEEFHRIIYQACHKSRVWQAIQHVNTDFNRVRMLRLQVNFDWQLILDHHQQIYRSIKEKNTEAADKITMQHLQLVVIEESEIRQEYPTYFK